MDQAMAFWRRPAGVRAREISRIMTQSLARFTHHACAREYIHLYERMLDRPLVSVS
jgi:starch synthase/alpha-amylase